MCFFKETGFIGTDENVSRKNGRMEFARFQEIFENGRRFSQTFSRVEVAPKQGMVSAHVMSCTINFFGLFPTRKNGHDLILFQVGGEEG